MHRAAFYTLGCKVNQYESHALMAAFMAEGFEIVPHCDKADVYIVNSCTVTAAGDKKSLRALRRFRRQAPEALTVLCGCYPQAVPEEAQRLTEADIITGSRGKLELVEAVKKKLKDKSAERSVDIVPHACGELFEPLPSPIFAGKTRAGLKIQDGCERRCSYCIIPDARGPFRSLPLDALGAELERTALAGYKEVVLVGINLSCYGVDSGLSLTDAIAAAETTGGIERVRLGSLEPELLDKETISRWQGFKKLCPQFHLSLQSGCDRTLRAMGRQYTGEKYLEIVLNLRAAFPGCAITTDIMVAFLGETEEDYAASETFVRNIAFARCHIFVYSPRPGTPAAALEGRIPPGEAKRRASQMAKAANELELAFLESQRGSVQPVLFEQMAGGLWQGHTGSYILVKVKSEEDLRGKILPVMIEQAGRGCCLGRLA